MTTDRTTAALAALEPDYEILRELGRGATAVVHLARERSSGAEVAIKLIRSQFVDDPEAVARFAREARFVAQLEHPNVVRLHDVRPLGDAGIALIMSHVSGLTLRQLLQRDGGLSVSTVERVMRGIASGLGAAHALGIVHRDVKPENVFIADDGTALLADFGVARSMSNDTQQLTMGGVAIGTPSYMAPEQIDGVPLDGRGDIYSLGLVAWEMLSGHRPWEGEALYSVLYHQKHSQVADIRSLRPDTPARLASAIAGAIEKERENRWPDTDALIAALDDTVPEHPWPAFTPAPTETIRVSRTEPEHALGAVAATPVDWSTFGAEPAFVTTPKRKVAKRGIAIVAGIAVLLALSFAVSAIGSRKDQDSMFAARPSTTDTLQARSSPSAVQQSQSSASGDIAPESSASGAMVAADAPLSVTVGGALPHADSLKLSKAARGVPPSVPNSAPFTPPTTRSTSPLAAPTIATAPLVVPVAPPVSRPAPRLGVFPGGRHTCLFIAEDVVSCWGSNDRGQLGAESSGSRSGGGAMTLRAVSLAAGLSHSCALTSDGAVLCWGDNDRGQLGDRSTSGHATPSRVADSRRFRAVSAGSAHSCALSMDGAAWCWGANDAGQLGDGTTSDRLMPTPVATRSRFESISAGWTFTCALDAEGAAYCWGDDSAGQLGDGSSSTRRGPVAVTGQRSFVALAAGSAHACGVTSSGEVYCWGNNSSGQLGDGTNAMHSAPVRVKSTERFVSVAAGAVHTCALTAEGAAYCWGRNTYGQLGNGGTTNTAVPEPVAGSHLFAAVHAFGSHTCGVTISSEVFCWGYNLDGQLGDGTRTHRTRPVYVDRLSSGG